MKYIIGINKMQIKKFFIYFFYIVVGINYSYSQENFYYCDNITDNQELLICEKNKLQFYNDSLNIAYRKIINKLTLQRDYYVANRAIHFEKSQKYWELAAKNYCKYKTINNDKDKEIAFISCLSESTKARTNSIKVDIQNLKEFIK